MSLEIAAFQSVPSHNSANGEIMKLDLHDPPRTRKKTSSVKLIIDILEKKIQKDQVVTYVTPSASLRSF